jgi:hypothetical protein
MTYPNGQFGQPGPPDDPGPLTPLTPYPAMPPPPASETAPHNPDAVGPPPPRELRLVVILLIVNVILSVVLTVVTIAFRHTIVDYQLDHRHITDPAQRESLRHSYIGTIIGRVIGNIVISIVYVFLVRALLRGRRWAYRRVIWIGGAGIVGLVLLQLSPYPPWMRVEQLTQAAVLAGLVYCVLRPEVKAHFAPHLPGRQVRRFNRR